MNEAEKLSQEIEELITWLNDHPIPLATADDRYKVCLQLIEKKNRLELLDNKQNN